MSTPELIWQNLVSMVPSIIGIAYLAIAPFLINIAADCPPNETFSNRERVVTVIVGSRPSYEALPVNTDPRYDGFLRNVVEREWRKGNPLTCKTGDWWSLVKESFLQDYKSFHRYIDDSEASRLRDEIGKAAEAHERAARHVAKVSTELPPLLDDKSLATWRAAVEVAEKGEKALQVQLKSLRESQADSLGAAAREAKGRLGWVVTAAVLFVANVAAVIVALWIIMDTAGEFLSASPGPARLQQNIDLVAIAASTVLVGLVLYLLWLFLHWWAGAHLFASMIRLPGTDQYYFFFPNSLFAYVERSLMPGISGIAEFLFKTSIVGALALAAGSAACLLVRSEDLKCWRSKDAPADRRAECVRAAMNSGHRLMALAIMGSVLLVAHVGHVWALLSWPTTLLSSDPVAAGLRGDMAAAVNQIVVGTAVGASVLLGSLLLPAALILRRRAWLIALSEPALATADMAMMHDWMKKNGLIYSVSGNVVQALTVLAPLIAGAIATSVQSLLVK